jgi:hypothetical protein
MSFANNEKFLTQSKLLGADAFIVTPASLNKLKETLKINSPEIKDQKR